SSRNHRRECVLNQVAEPLVEPRRRGEKPASEQQLLNPCFPAGRSLGAQIWIAYRKFSRVVLEERWLLERGAQRRPDSGTIRQSKGGTQPVRPKGAERVVIVHSATDVQRQPSRNIGEHLGEVGAVHPAKVQR